MEDKNFAREISRDAGLCEEAVKWRASKNPKDYINYPIHQIQRIEKELNKTYNRIDLMEKHIENLQKKICDLEKE